MDPRDPNDMFRDLTCGAVPVAGGGSGQVAVAAFPGFVRIAFSGAVGLWAFTDVEPFMAERLADILSTAAEKAE